MTKKEARARRTAWTLALIEGRVLRFFNGSQLTSYPTAAQRDAALANALAAGVPCEVVVTEGAR